MPVRFARVIPCHLAEDFEHCFLVATGKRLRKKLVQTFVVRMNAGRQPERRPNVTIDVISSAMFEGAPTKTFHELWKVSEVIVRMLIHKSTRWISHECQSNRGEHVGRLISSCASHLRPCHCSHFRPL